MAPVGPAYQKDERVLCFHHDILYEAKILDIRHSDPEDRKSPYEYLVHYKGWKNTWDDWVPPDRLRKFTEENRELAATLRRDAEAALRQRSGQKSASKRKGGSDSGRGSEERQSSVPARGSKRGRDNDIEKEEHFYQRPSIRITLPDNLKALLVDDWENITKNQQVVSLPATHSVNQILDAYAEEERAKRGVNSADRDVLDEVIMGLKEYFDKTLDKLLLYRFEREQYRTLRQKWESGGRNSTYKGPLDVYGAHHLTRLFATLPELIAQTNMDQQSINRLREELSKFTLWLSRHADEYFSDKYVSASGDYLEKVTGVPVTGTASARLV